MNAATHWLLALAVSMDACAVAMGIGMSLRRASVKDACCVGLAFGIMQGLMPLLGYGLGGQLLVYVDSVGQWLVFGILVAFGAHMLWEGAFGKGESHDVVGLGQLLLLSVMTSIDAFAVGVSLAIMQGDIWLGATLFLLVAGGLSALGLLLGNQLGQKLQNKAHLVGGLMLIGAGIHALM